MELTLPAPTCAALRLAVLVLAIGAPGCSGDAPLAPSKLVDGSPARPPPVELEGVDDPSIATSVLARPAGAVPVGSRSASCIASIGATAVGEVVERVGVSGVSVTFFGPGGRTAYACDATVDEPGDHGTWCGQAFGRVEAGRLNDPRLSLSCNDPGGSAIGFAWVQPTGDVSYVVVHRRGYAEAYPVAGDAPARVTTGDVDAAASTAKFPVSEHARDGRQLREYTVEAQVAG